MIFDYTKYLKFDAYYGEGFETHNRELIDVLNTKCPYCGNELKQEYYVSRYDRGLSGRQELFQWETMHYCENDGWWQHKINEESMANPKAWYSVIHEGILTEYHEDSSSIPIEVLNDYIYKNPEKITHIHELGATLLQKSQSCIFVTTANKFSKEAEKTASLGIDLGLVKRFELINYNRFINMLKSEPKKIQQTWEKIKTLDKLDEDEHYGLGYLG